MHPGPELNLLYTFQQMSAL